MRDPCGTQVSIFFLCVYFVCLFVELRCTRYATLQHSSTSGICFFFFVLQEKKKKKKAMASPSFSSFLCSIRSCKEEGYAAVAFFFMLWSCYSVAAQLRATELLQPSSLLLHCCYAATQLHEEGDGSCAVASFFFFFFVQRKKKRKKKATTVVVALSPSSSYCGVAILLRSFFFCF